jgi:hypothetical protein
MSRTAEQHFNRVGGVDPMWLVETASGEQRLIVSPIEAPTALAAHDYKDRLAAKMRETFRELDVVRYARAVEAWSAPHGRPDVSRDQAALQYAAIGYTFANHPDRREVVHIAAEDGTEHIFALREIVRPQQGKPYLGKLGEISRPDHIEGRFLGLLPNEAHERAAKEATPPSDVLPRLRSSGELPDDIGRVFVTNVPNAPIQVMGRRDPATGELCAGSTILSPSPLKDMPASYLSDVEIVTGPEAERLILAVHARLTERADAEGLTIQQYARIHHETKDTSELHEPFEIVPESEKGAKS